VDERQIAVSSSAMLCGFKQWRCDARLVLATPNATRVVNYMRAIVSERPLRRGNAQRLCRSLLLRGGP